MIGRTLGPQPLSTSNLANFFYTRPTEFLDLATIFGEINPKYLNISL